MAFIGYIVHGDDNGTPIAAGMDHDSVFSRTFQRIVELSAGDFWTLSSAQMAVQERDITEEQAEQMESLILEHWGKYKIAD